MAGISGKIRNFFQVTFHIRRAVSFVWKGSPFWMVYNLIIQMLQGVFPLLLLLLLKRMVDEVSLAASGSGDYSRILNVILLTGAVTLLNTTFQILGGWGTGEQGRHVSDYMSEVILKKAGRLDFSFFEDSKSLDSLHRAQEQASYRPAQIVQSLASIVRNLISLTGVIWIIFQFHPLIVLILFMAAFPGLANRIVFSTREYRNEKRYTQKERRSFYHQYLILDRDSAKEVRLYNLADRVLERYGLIRKELRKLRHDLDVHRTIVSILTQLFLVILIFGAYAWIAGDVITGSVTVGSFIMFYQAFQRGQAFLRAFLSSFASLYSHNLFLQNLYDFLDKPSTVVSPEIPEKWERTVQGNISFNGISFAYPGTSRLVIDKLDLTLNRGEVVALVGLNGCGKTTLVKLLCRLYDVDGGSITFDGHDIKALSLDELRKNVSVVFQDFNRYNLSLEDNVSFGDIHSSKSREKLDRAVEKAGARELLESLPDGYETLLGVLFEKGRELSGGQWQKIAMARAFYRDSPLVILDEPTSSLDPRSEYEIFKRFRSMMENRTALLISHRMATVRMADRICVMNNGKIAEQGTHGELMEKKGLYYELFTLQAQNYQ